MLISDIFPVRYESLPKLYKYEINTTDNKNSVAGKLAYRLKKMYHGHWASSFGNVISDKNLSLEEINKTLNELWKDNNSQFKNLIGMKLNRDSVPSTIEISEFVAKGILSDFYKQVASKIKNENVTNIKNARITRQHELRGLVVDNRPAVSISVSSKITLEGDLEDYIRSGKDPVGKYVAVSYQSTKGEVTRILGPLSEHRKRLMSQAQDTQTLRAIEEAHDDVDVVAVRTGQNTYSYIASSLNIILTLQNAYLFGISSKQISQYLKFTPDNRKRLISLIERTMTGDAHNEQSILLNNFDSRTNPELFPNLFKVPYSEPVIVGKGEKCEFNPRAIMNSLRRFGLYKYSNNLKNRSIKIGLLMTSSYKNEAKVQSFVNKVKNLIKTLGFDLVVPNIYKFDQSDRVDLERSINDLIENGSDVILAFFPEKPDDEGDLEEVDLYHVFKQVTIKKGVGGQVVNYDTLDNEYAIDNIILGVLGKTGNIPYVLANPLDFCDIVVGLDIAREKKQNLPGSKNAAAIARVYFNNGDFLKYTIHDAPLEGETIPREVLDSLFPVEEFEGKRVIIHRDGYFRGEERKTLEKRAKSIGAEFSLVEVIKTEAPRLYLEDSGNITSPKKGTVFMIDDCNAFLISSPPPFRGSTPRPVRIRNYGPINTNQAIRSILALTQLHYGSLNPPRMPVTIHYSDKIAYFALKGIKPPELTGSIPFWL